MSKLNSLLFTILLVGMCFVINASSQTKNFLCQGDAALRADFSNNWRNVRVRFGTQDFRLKRVASEEGSKYVARGTMFWVNGNNAEIQSKVLDASCKIVEMTNMATTRVVKYICDGDVDLSAEFFEIGSPKRVRIKYGTQDFTLPLVRAAAGSKYHENRTTFWLKGGEGFLTSQVLNSTCRVQK